MKKNKIVGLIASFMVFICMFVVISFAAESGEFIYTVEDGCAVITGYTGSGGEVTIPSTIDGYKVSRIGERAFAEIDTISKITISDGIVRIDDSAFAHVSATHIVLPDSVTSIGDYAFSRCVDLKNIVLSDNLETIGQYAFQNTMALKTVVLPDTLVDLGSNAFAGGGIRKITIPKNLEKIPGQAFAWTNLTEITIPASVKDIGYGAFKACYKLKAATFMGEIEKIGNSVFAHCNKLENINIPDSVTEIGNSAFQCCFALAELKLPSKLEVIGEFAFDNCVALTKITIPDNVSKIGHRAFFECKKLELIDLNKVTEVGEEAFAGCNKLKQVIFGASIKKVVTKAFSFGMNKEFPVYVCYRGTEAQWKKVKFYSGNAGITNQPIHFNYTEAHQTKLVTNKATFDTGGTINKKCKICDYECIVEEISRPYIFELSKSKYYYDGKTKTPKVVVKDTYRNVLKEDTDYTVSYEKGRKLPGKYTVKITFKGRYSGVKRLYFTINPKATSKITASQTTTTITLKWSKVTGATGYRIYQYNSKTEKYEKINTTTSRSYKVTGLKAGTTYKFKIKAYSKVDGKTLWGKSTSAFTTATKPKKPTLNVTSTVADKATLTWTNVSGESGYQVYYSTKKDSGFKKMKSYKANTKKATKSDLKSGKTYYFKVRAYKKVDGKTIYGSFSSVKIK